MFKLIKKEFMLAMHPTVPLMLLLSAMVFIPGYPYGVMFFYVTLSVFFTCLGGRENNDVVYSLNLPVAKKDIVKARITFVCLIQLVQLLITLPFIPLAQKVKQAGNPAGLDSNMALIGLGLLVYGLFNLVFFSSYYRNVENVGKSFVKSCFSSFGLITVEVVSTYALPFVSDKLDTPDPLFIKEKAVFDVVCLLIYVLITVLVCRKSIRNFDRQDLH